MTAHPYLLSLSLTRRPGLASPPQGWYRRAHSRVVATRIGINVYFFSGSVQRLEIDAYGAAEVYSRKGFVSRDLAGLADLARLRAV